VIRPHAAAFVLVFFLFCFTCCKSGVFFALIEGVLSAIAILSSNRQTLAEKLWFTERGKRFRFRAGSKGIIRGQ